MILDRIVEATKIRVAQEKQVETPEAVKAAALALPSDTGFPFEAALRQQDFNFICEVKKASPSKGIIAEHFPYLDIAKEYEVAGAAAISVLTEPDFFKGDKKYLQEIGETYCSYFENQVGGIWDVYSTYSPKYYNYETDEIVICCKDCNAFILDNALDFERELDSEDKYEVECYDIYDGCNGYEDYEKHITIKIK